MGAQLWHHQVPWHEDPEAALHALQEQVLRDKYNLTVLLTMHLDGAREAVRLSEADDPYDLLEFCRKELARLETLASQRIPADPRQQVELVRHVFANSGQGVGDVLDVTGVSDCGGMHVTKRLAPKEVQRLCGAEHPDLRQATAAVPKINEELGRGESVCFPFYSAASPEPAGWYFVGNTID